MSLVFTVGNAVGTNGERQAQQLNAKTGERESGLRSGLEQRDRRQDDDPTGEQQEESNDSHEKLRTIIAMGRARFGVNIL